MTAVSTAPVLTTTPAAQRLRTVLLEDGVVTAAVGADVALASRVREDRLALAGTVVGELALGWAVASTAVVLVAGASATVTAAVLAVAAVSVAFGVTELRLARALRR